MRILWSVPVTIVALLSAPTFADDSLPVFDVHLHASGAADQGPPPLAMCTPYTVPLWDPARPYFEAFLESFKGPDCNDPFRSPETDDAVRDRTSAVMERRNVVGILSGKPERVGAWRERAPGRFHAGLGFNLAVSDISPDDIRVLRADGSLDALAEIASQYPGIAPDDPRMEPYWDVAEELAVPVGIHIATGQPGLIYLGSSGYRARLQSPLTLEDVLVRHPKLRIYIMHAGLPVLDDTLAMLSAHPELYVGVGELVYTQPHAGFFRYLQALVDAGFGKRIMFGSDLMVWPETIARGIRVIEEATFLTRQQKRDILYDNAARFFRPGQATVARLNGK